jgi:hypothetical protein
MKPKTDNNKNGTVNTPDEWKTNTIKNPDDWKTGDEPITGAQSSYLETLASEAHEKVDTHISKAEAAKKIEELQQKTGRGLDKNDGE